MIIIPARLASSRFPKKILADIFGFPMVIKTAKAVEKIDDVLIATDSSEVIDIAKKYGIKAVLSQVEHQSGTDRINEAAQIIGLSDNDIVINVQGDEPFIETHIVEAVKKRVEELSKKRDFTMVSCYKPISCDEAKDPNLVKVVTNHDNDALYFSRSAIPYDREGIEPPYFGHLGIYGFTYKSLREFCSFTNAPLEHIEKLEQLRALYFGKKISMIEVVSKSFGIDTPQDLKRALDIFR